MRFSLAARLATLVVIIMIVTIFVVIVVTTLATRDEFEGAIKEGRLQDINIRDQEEIASHIEAELADQNGSRLTEVAAATVASFDPLGVRFTILDDNLRVVASTEAPFESATVDRLESGAMRFNVDEPSGEEFFDLELIALSPRPLLSETGTVVGQLVMMPDLAGERDGITFAIQVWKYAAPWMVIVLTLAVLLTVWLMRRALRPIDRITSAVASLTAGSFPDVVKIEGSGSEFDKLIETFNAATKTLAETDNIRRQIISDIAH